MDPGADRPVLPPSDPQPGQLLPTVRCGRAPVRRQPSVEIVGVIYHDPADAHIRAAAAVNAQLFKGGFGKAGVGRSCSGAKLGAGTVGCFRSL